MGNLVIVGMKVSDGQTWWQSNVRYLAGGMILSKSAAVRRFSGKGFIRRDQLPHTQERIFQHQTCQFRIFLVLGGQLHSHSSTQALPIYDDVMVPRLSPVAQIIIRRLSIDHEASLIRAPRAQSVPSIFQHEHVASHAPHQHARDGNSVSDIPCIAMEHQDSDITLRAAFRAADVERRQLFIVGRRDHQVFKVAEVKL
jgi:hypothetical protein